MRAYELIKETYGRRPSIKVIHISWFVLYGVYYWLSLPDDVALGRFVFIWAGVILPLALTSGIFGDDIASGRISVLVTKPFWMGKLYLYRLLGLSVQGTLHLLLARILCFVLPLLMGKKPPQDLALWFIAAWMLFNTWAALSTSLSVVMNRSYNTLLLLVSSLACFVVVLMLTDYLGLEADSDWLLKLIRYTCPPFELLLTFAGGDRRLYSLFYGRLGLAQNMACVLHSLVITAAYSSIGIVLLGRRQFSRARD
ncbi:hypothetical protein ACFL6U_02730 [Planctomycetota bacterium]